MNKAVLLFSGGLDSYCYGGMYRKDWQLYGLTFIYGQRAKEKEINTVKKLAPNLEFKEHHIIDMDFMKKLYGSSNVVTGSGVPDKKFNYSVVIPVRNAIFLSIATAWAYSIGAIKVLLASPLGYGVVGIPDAGLPFLKHMDKALRFGELLGITTGKRREVDIDAPCMNGLTKEHLIRKAYTVLGDSIFHTWSCHLGGNLHCGECNSCNERKEAFIEAEIDDKTKYK